MHEVLVNRLGALSLPRKSVVRLTDRPDMTLDVYRGRKTTMQQQRCISVEQCCYAAAEVNFRTTACDVHVHVVVWNALSFMEFGCSWLHFLLVNDRLAPVFVSYFSPLMKNGFFYLALLARSIPYPM